MSSFPTQKELGFYDRMTLLGPCKIFGRLYDLGDYPGLIIDSDKKQLVSAELYYLTDQEILSELDDFEDYKVGNEQGSLYKRVLVNAYDPSLKAWVYLYNRAVLESNFIKSGNWKEFILSKTLTKTGENNVK